MLCRAVFGVSTAMVGVLLILSESVNHAMSYVCGREGRYIISEGMLGVVATPSFSRLF
jgi:hypothetical protein